jgi:hypothetical protein
MGISLILQLKEEPGVMELKQGKITKILLETLLRILKALELEAIMMVLTMF